MVTALNRWRHEPARLAARWLLPICLVGVAQAQESVQLTVRQGDTLIGISQRYLDAPTRWPQLQKLNRVANPRRLAVGSSLRVPVEWLRWDELPAHVVFVQGPVTVNGSAVAVGVRLNAGDRLDTGAQGSVALRLADGAMVVFVPMTQAILGVTREAPAFGIRSTRIDLQRGELDTTATPLQNPASRFEIRTPRVVTAVRGTRFRVSADDEVSRHEVVTGQVALTGSDLAAVPVGQGQGVRAQAGRLGAVVQLLAAPDLSALPTLVERTAQPLEIAPMAQASGWHWQVARDSEFVQLLQDVRTRVPAWLLTGLPDGLYQLRVRVADAQDLEGAEARHTLRISARP